MKKICFVLTTDAAINAFLLNHLRALSALYNVTVVVNTQTPNFLADMGIKATVIPLSIAREIRLHSDLLSLFRLIRIFHQQGFHAVHSVTPKAGLLAMLAAWVLRVPLRVHTFTGQVWVTKLGFKRFLLKQFDRLIAALTTHNIVDSPSQRDFLIRENVMSASKAHVFGSGSISGVDVARFKPDQLIRASIRQSLNISEDKVVLLFLGRLTIDKGLLDLAQAFSQMDTAHAYLLFVGPDEQHLQAEIMRIASTNSANMHFVGQTSTPEHYMAAADVLCLPSYREGFGSVIIEAAAAGISAVASRIYGITDAIIDGETGLLHAPKDTDGIKNCLQNMLNNPTLRLKLGKQARSRAIKEFDSHLITQAWVNFYRKNLN